MVDERKQAIEKLKNATPLETTKILQEIELYDAKSSQEIIDEVYEQFASGEHMTEEIVKPVFLAVVDGLLEGTSIGKSARRKGLTASRFIQECENFSYNAEPASDDVNGYTEYKNAQDAAKAYGDAVRPDYDRDTYGNTYAMNKYKKNKIEENNGRKNLEDEYTGKRNITAHRSNPDQRRNDPKNDYQAETDHIIPLKQIHSQLKNNYALSDEDIRKIANQDDNFALTSGKLNGKKLDNRNSDFIKEQERLKKEGKPYFELDNEAKKRMIQLEKDAQKAIDSNVNQTVLKNITGKGNSDKQKEIFDTSTKNAANQAKDYAVGNIILYIIKPIYYEISDIFKNGICDGVGAASTMEALTIRFGRVKKYVIENASTFLGNNMLDFIKGFVSSLIEGIIGLFAGIFKQILKIVKEGIKIFVQSAKVLFGKDSKNMTPAQKGDAIIKILGGSVIAIAGVVIESLLNKIGIGEPWSVILSTMLSGIASALFMYILDKADIFSVKAEKRKDRILEIFNERIADIKEAAEAYDTVTIEILRKQREEFEDIRSQIDNGIETNNILEINDGLYKIADFMNVDLGYSNTEEFCDYMDSESTIYL